MEGNVKARLLRWEREETSAVQTYTARRGDSSLAILWNGEVNRALIDAMYISPTPARLEQQQ